jgi:glycosyltransferase involved in cell wall biosynthesis
MACGTALVTTDNGGCRDYAFDGETCLVVPPGQPQQIADGIMRLFEHEPLRLRLSMAGHEFVQRFTWQRAIDQLEAVIAAR